MCLIGPEASGCNQQQQQQQQQRQQKEPAETITRKVTFSPYASQITLPPVDIVRDADDAILSSSDSANSTNSQSISNSSLWYSKQEMTKLARAEVDAHVAQTRQLEQPAAAADNNTTATMMICGRGIEMYLPGQLVVRQRRRKAYQQAALRKRELLLTLHGRTCYTELEEVAERLERFLAIQSRGSNDEAQAYGVQDALEAQEVHSESDVKTSSKTVVVAVSVVMEATIVSASAATTPMESKQIQKQQQTGGVVYHHRKAFIQVVA